MGCFNVSCAVSHITIQYGDRAFLFPLLPNVSVYQLQNGHPDDGTVIIKQASQYLHPDEHYVPFCFPIEGTYDDYGSLENIVENENTKALENFLGISIRNLVDLSTHHRPERDSYELYGTCYEIFFDKKEYMDEDITFEDFLIGMGFEQNGTDYSFPGANYRVQKTIEGYILSIEEEVDNNIKKKLKLLNLNDPYNRKNNLLKAHLLIEKEYLGVRNKFAFEIARKLSGMFVHGDIYDFFTKKNDVSDNHYMNMKVSRYFLRKLGFKQMENGIFTNSYIRVKYDGYLTILKRRYQEIKVYGCNDFLEGYKALTGEILTVPKDFDYDEIECQFEDMAEIYNKTKKSLLDRISYAEQIGKEILILLTKNDFENGGWRRAIDELREFKNMKYFFSLYEEMIADKSLRPFYVKYIRFVRNMDNTNVMFFPTFQGVQCGDTEAERALAMKTLEILDRRYYEENET